MRIARAVFPAILLLFAGFALTSCAAPATKPQTFVCDQCGQIQGSDLCCKEGVALCEKCGLQKDSPGCCKMEKGKGKVPFCDECNAICTAGCEDPKAAKCEDCGKVEGSKDCCKTKE